MDEKVERIGSILFKKTKRAGHDHIRISPLCTDDNGKIFCLGSIELIKLQIFNQVDQFLGIFFVRSVTRFGQTMCPIGIIV